MINFENKFEDNYDSFLKKHRENIRYELADKYSDFCVTFHRSFNINVTMWFLVFIAGGVSIPTVVSRGQILGAVISLVVLIGTMIAIPFINLNEKIPAWFFHYYRRPDIIAEYVSRFKQSAYDEALEKLCDDVEASSAYSVYATCRDYKNLCAEIRFFYDSCAQNIIRYEAFDYTHH